MEKESKNRFYVTTPIYYANGSPHIGSAYTTIAADILARWNKIKGKDVFFLTGLDEHGENIQKVAEEDCKEPQKFVDKIAIQFKEAFKLLNIDYNYFIRTTNSDHVSRVLTVLQKLYDNGLIYKGDYEAYYCVGCEQYLTKSDLKDGKCPLHNKDPEIHKEEAYLFKLSEFQDKLLELVKSGKYCILPLKKRNEMISFIEQGLKDISISRRKEKVSWGVELPFDKEHTCYVWVDAFWNYITGLQINEKYDKFWPPQLQLMANDILRVHATIWPALLLALDIPLPEKLFIHGYFTVNGKKMSKTIGNVIDPIKLVKKYGADSVRYFIIRNIPFGDDGDVSIKGLEQRHNSELANKLGNLVSRVSTLAEKFGIEKTENQLILKLKLKEIDKLMENLELDKALTLIFEFIDNCNEYIQEKKPWESGDKKILYELVESIKDIAKLLWPFIPETSEKITNTFNTDKIKKAEILFKKIK